MIGDKLLCRLYGRGGPPERVFCQGAAGRRHGFVIDGGNTSSIVTPSTAISVRGRHRART